MRRNPLKATHLRFEDTPWRVVLWTAAAVVLLWLTATLAGTPPSDMLVHDERERARDDGETVEAVTMSIELEAGAAVDLETSISDITIDRWQGDDVVVILERSPKAGEADRRPIKPFDIRVTRDGRDVRIEAVGGAGVRLSDFDITFKIMIPETNRLRYTNVGADYSLAKLTSVLLKVLHKEAVRWILH